MRVHVQPSASVVCSLMQIYTTALTPMPEKQNIPCITKSEWMNGWDSFPKEYMNKLVCDYFYFEGYADLLRTFCGEANVKYASDTVLEHRSEIRKLIESGRVEEARSLLIDFDVELVDSDKTINYFLLCQRAMEILNQTEDDESVLHFISEKIYPITDDELRESLKDLLEYLVFKTGDSIEVRRRKLASFINGKILSKYNCRPNKLKDIVKGILEGESKLQSKYKFPMFRSYL